MKFSDWLNETRVDKEIEGEKVSNLISKNCSDILSFYKQSNIRLYRRIRFC